MQDDTSRIRVPMVSEAALMVRDEALLSLVLQRRGRELGSFASTCLGRTSDGSMMITDVRMFGC